MNMRFQLISKFRTELMGYAMVGVLVGHILAFGQIPTNGGVVIVKWLSYLIHTMGFLFLSGFGVYYSLSNNRNVKDFYKRRFYRFMLPFLIVAIPYFLVVTVSNRGSVLDYLGKISTISFWIKGNYHGMWYIAISLALYIICPPPISLVHKWI